MYHFLLTSMFATCRNIGYFLTRSCHLDAQLLRIDISAANHRCPDECKRLHRQPNVEMRLPACTSMWVTVVNCKVRERKAPSKR